MADFIKSDWRITWDPAGAALVLLDYDDRMLEELTFSQQHLVQVQTYLRADHVDTWDRGGVSYNPEFSVVKEFNTAAEAMDHQMQHALAVAALRDAVMKVEIRGGGSFEFAAASIQSATPHRGPSLGAANRVAWVYSIISSQGSDTTP